MSALDTKVSAQATGVFRGRKNVKTELGKAGKALKVQFNQILLC